MKLTEAFRALNALNEDTFSVSDDGIAKLAEFEQNDDLADDISVIDPEAETEEDLEDSYVGKVILDCTTCHSKLFKDLEEIELNDDQTLANVEEECPYCYTVGGFKVMGEVSAFGGKTEESEDSTDTDDAKPADTDDKDDDVVEESLQEAVATLDRPMSGIGGTLSNVMAAHSDELANVYDTASAISFLDSIEPEVKNKGYLQNIKAKLAKMPSTRAAQFLYNIILKGDGMGTKMESVEEDLLVRGEDGQLTTTSQKGRWGNSKEWDYNNESLKEDAKIIRCRDCKTEFTSNDELDKAMYKGVPYYICSVCETPIKRIPKSELDPNNEIEYVIYESKYIKEAPDADGVLYDYEVGAKYNDMANAEMKRNAEYRKQIAEYKSQISKLVPEIKEMLDKIRSANKTYLTVSAGRVHRGTFEVEGDFRIDSEYKVDNVPEGSSYLTIKHNDSGEYASRYSASVTDSGEIYTWADTGSWTNFDLRDKGYATSKALKFFLDKFDAVKARFKIDLAPKEYIYKYDEKFLDSKLAEQGYDPENEEDYDYILDYERDRQFVNNKTVKLISDKPDENGMVDIEYGYNQKLTVYFSELTPINESLKESKSIKEDVNNVNVETDDSIVNVNTDDSGKVTVTTEPKTAQVSPEDGAEVITPLTDENEQVILNNDSDMPLDDEEEFVDTDIEEFDDETFNGLGESYLKKVYENVASYKTTDVSMKENKLFLEGVITFNSGASKKTSFIFEAKDFTKSGKYRFIGENTQLTRGKKAFTLKGRIDEKKFITESFNYNYKAKDTAGNSTRIYGTIKG